MGELRPTIGPAEGPRKAGLLAIALTAVLVLLQGLGDVGRVSAASPPGTACTNSLAADTSDAARHDAERSIPLNKLAPDDRAKINSVLANVSIFRRLPIKVIDCDPDMYLFLVRHPEIVTNIWEVMRVSGLRLRQVGQNEFHVSEPAGAEADFEFVYKSYDTHVLYGEGTYDGPLLSRPAKGRGVLVLKCGYVRETNGRYYITSRLDCFLSIDRVGVELLGKTISPLVGKTVDHNFAQTLAFVGSLSRTAEVNGRGVQRMSAQLTGAAPDVRQQFAELASGVAERSALAASHAEKRTELTGSRDGNLER
jgi:hypothetical protein